jgi:hypothetical protein
MDLLLFIYIKKIHQKNMAFIFLGKKKSLKSRKSSNPLFQKTFQLNQNDLIEVQKKKELKQKKVRSKRTKW